MTKVSEKQESAPAAKSWPSSDAATPDDAATPVKAAESVQLAVDVDDAECDGDRSHRRRQASVKERCVAAARQKCGVARECAARTWRRCNETVAQVVA